MYWLYVLYSAILFTTAIGMTILAVYIWRKRTTPRTNAIAIFVLLAALLGYIFIIMQFSNDAATVYFWARLRFLLLAALPPLSLIIILTHLDYARWLKRPLIVALFIVPAITNVIIWTAPHLFWINWSYSRTEFLSIETPTYAGWYYIYVSYGYVLFALVFMILLQQLARSPNPYRKQNVLLLIAMVTALLFNVPSTLTLLPGTIPNLTPIGGALFGLIGTWVIMRYKFLNLAPVAYNRVINTMSDVVIVLDEFGRVLDLNPSALKIVQSSLKDAIGKPLVELIPTMNADIRPYLSRAGERRGETTIVHNGGVRYFDINSSSLYRSAQHVGYVMVLRDITEQKQIAQTVQRQNEHLSAQYNIVLDLLGPSDMDSLLQNIVEQAAQILTSPLCEIMLKEGEELVIYASTFTQPYHKGDRIKRGQGFLTWQAYDTQQPVVLADYAKWNPRNPLYDGMELHPVASFPIVAENICLGVMDLGRTDINNPFNAEYIQKGVTFAQLAALAIRNAQHQQQSRELAASEERQRLARELHDNVMQTLFSASLIAQALPYYGRKDEQIWVELDKLNRLTRGAMAEMRTLLFELRPASLTTVGLPDLLSYLSAALIGQTDAHVSQEFDGVGSLPPDVQLAAYRIAQEAYNNIAKHAHATEVTTVLKHNEDYVDLLITDNGHGFDIGPIPADHFGIQFMRERAQVINGELMITSEPGCGTKVHFMWKENGDS